MNTYIAESKSHYSCLMDSNIKYSIKMQPSEVGVASSFWHVNIWSTKFMVDWVGLHSFLWALTMDVRVCDHTVILFFYYPFFSFSLFLFLIQAIMEKGRIEFKTIGITSPFFFYLTWFYTLVIWTFRVIYAYTFKYLIIE